MADELRGYDRDRAMGRVEAIYRTLREVFSIAREEDVPTNEAADRFALARIEASPGSAGTGCPGGPPPDPARCGEAVLRP